MPDGSAMRANALTNGKALTLEEGITRLEAGEGEGLVVDLGAGRLAAADGHRGPEGLLQRLRGHRMMLALASGTADLSRFVPSNDKLVISPLVQEILDAATQRD